MVDLPVASGDRLLDLLNGFIAELRAVGIPASLTENLDAMEAVKHVPITDRETFKYALAATLVKNQAHWKAFETVFEVYFSLRGAQYEIEADDPDDVDAPEGEIDAGGNRGGAGEMLSGEELAEMLYRALLRGDSGMLRAAARQAVRRYAGMEPGRPVGGTYYLYRTLRNLDLDGVLERLLEAEQHTEGGVDDFDLRLQRDTYELRVAELKAQIEAEIRRRLVTDRGVEAMAKTLRKPLPADIDFMHASREEMASPAQGDLPADPPSWPPGWSENAVTAGPAPSTSAPRSATRCPTGACPWNRSSATRGPTSPTSWWWPMCRAQWPPSPGSRCTSCTHSPASSRRSGRSCSSTDSTR